MKTIVLSYIISLLILSSGNICVLQDKNGRDNNPFYIDFKKNQTNVKALNMSSIGKELLYIPLETTPDCLIPKIDQIEFSDSFIFVSETQRLLQFDKNGKFIRQIGSQGRGPEEYISVPDFCIDEKLREIFIISNGRLMVFNFDGHFKTSYKLSVRPSQIILKDQNCLMLHLFNLPGQPIESSFSWIITDNQGITIAKIKNCLKRVNKPGMIIKDSPLYSFNNIVHFMESGIDTLYYYQGAQKKTYSIFAFGNLKMDLDQLLTPATIKEAENRNKDKLWINSVCENNEYLFIKLSRGLSDSSMYSTFNKNTAETIILKDKFFKNDIDDGAGFWPKHIFCDSILVDYVDAFDLLKIIKKKQSGGSVGKADKKSEKLINLGKQITETSNPVLVVLK